MANLNTLLEFILTNPEPRELKRAVAVQMVLEGYRHQEIKDQLGVTSGFISKWKSVYATQGIDGLKLAHKGKSSYLTPEQKQQVIDWITAQSYCTIDQVKRYVLNQYDVVFKSNTSYYKLLQITGKLKEEYSDYGSQSVAG
jgi:putative transposase